MVMAVMGLVEDHVKVTAVNPRLFHPGNLHPESFRRDGRKHSLKLLFIRSQVQEGSHNHISADTGIAFKIKCFHAVHSPHSPTASRLICVAM